MLSLLFLFLAVQTAAPPKPPPAEDFFSGPYCGLYCVYALLRSTGQEVDFDAMISQRHVNPSKGSSAPQLIAVLAEHGLSARAVANLDLVYLRAVGNPVILHCRLPGHEMPFNHWILVLGYGDGGFQDQPHRFRIPLAFRRLRSKHLFHQRFTTTSAFGTFPAFRAMGERTRGFLVNSQTALRSCGLSHRRSSGCRPNGGDPMNLTVQPSRLRMPSSASVRGCIRRPASTSMVALAPSQASNS